MLVMSSSARVTFVNFQKRYFIQLEKTWPIHRKGLLGFQLGGTGKVRSFCDDRLCVQLYWVKINFLRWSFPRNHSDVLRPCPQWSRRLRRQIEAGCCNSTVLCDRYERPSNSSLKLHRIWNNSGNYKRTRNGLPLRSYMDVIEPMLANAQ